MLSRWPQRWCCHWTSTLLMSAWNLFGCDAGSGAFSTGERQAYVGEYVQCSLTVAVYWKCPTSK